VEKVRVASVIKRLHIGGDQVRLLSFASSVDRDRFEHVVIVVQGTDSERDDRIGPMMAAYRDAGVDVVVLGKDIVSVTGTPAPVSAGPRRRAADLLAAVAVLRQLVVLFRERRPDVVDARLNFGTVFGLLAARLTGVPVVVSTAYYPEHWRRPPMLEPVGQLAMALVDALVTDADATIAAFDRWRWSKRARLVMIPNGVPAATSRRSREEMRRHFGLPEDPRVRVVGSVCRMIEGKGYPTFIRAARQVLDADPDPDVAFLFCGYSEDPQFRRSLVELAASVGLGDRAVFTSYPGPVGDVLAALDVYVRPSLEDSSPIGVHEAMSVGLPIVVTDVGGVAELVEHEQTALLVPPEDPGALSAAILRLCREPDLRGRLSRNGVARFEERHTSDRMARAHEELFLDLLRSKGRLR
jgi:glycosyltransferase involved in cell wall biosynthesis